MRTVLIVSVIGQETDGFMHKLTVATKALNGKWLANKVAHMDGQIAGLLKMEIDSDKLPEFKQMTQEFPDFTFNYHESKPESEEDLKFVKLTLEGEDRSGLTSDITHLLYNQDVRVEKFESQRYPVTGLGTDVFEAHLDVKLPSSLSVSSLKEALESLSTRMRVFSDEE